MIDEFVKRARSVVKANGYQVVLVPSAEEGQPAYGFTIGLTESYQHPELVVVGLDKGKPDGLMHDLLDAAAEVVAGGTRFAAGEQSTTLAIDYRLEFRPVSAANQAEWLEVLHTYYGGPDAVSSLQIVWPDPEHRFPWDEGCDADTLSRQPLLDE